MYKSASYLPILFLIGLIYSSCEDKQAIPPDPYPNNTIAATLGENPGTGPGRFIYTPQEVKFSGDTLSIYAAIITGADGGCSGTEYLGIYIHAKQTGTYILSNLNYAIVGEFGFCSLNSFGYSTDSIHTGMVNLTTLDTINHITSGTFSFVGFALYPLVGTDTVTNGIINNVTW